MTPAEHMRAAERLDEAERSRRANSPFFAN